MRQGHDKKDGGKNMTSKKSKSLPKGKTKKLNTEYALPQEKYEFSLDDDATLQNMGDVYFIMELAPNTDPNELRSKLELIALGTDKIGYANYMPNIGYMVCVTNLEAYEKLFDSELQKVDKEKQSRQLRYTTEGYREVRPSKVPPELEDNVARIFLNYVNR